MAAPAPKKLTIKLRPVGAKPAATPVAATTSPTPEVVQPAVAPTPAAESTVEAPVVEPMPATTPMVDITTEAAQQAKRQTSRIELPPELTDAPMNAQEAATIRLKPISQTAEPAKEDVQASKSKTARIALDSVLGGIQANTPLANTTQKTIKLKRAATPTSAPASTTTSTPMAAVGSEDKTIKLAKPNGLSIKKPATLGLKKPAPVAESSADDGLESLDTLESLDDNFIMPVVEEPAKESAVSKAFTIIGALAAAVAIVLGIMTWMILQKQACSPDGSEPTGNTLHCFAMERF